MTITAQDITPKLHEFFSTGRGARAVAQLRNEACIKLVVDGQEFALSKIENELDITSGAPGGCDAVLEASCSALDYFLSAKDDSDMRQRMGECATNLAEGKLWRLTLTLPPGPQGRSRYFWMGYPFFARRMGFNE